MTRRDPEAERFESLTPFEQLITVALLYASSRIEVDRVQMTSYRQKIFELAAKLESATKERFPDGYPPKGIKPFLDYTHDALQKYVQDGAARDAEAPTQPNAPVFPVGD